MASTALELYIILEYKLNLYQKNIVYCYCPQAQYVCKVQYKPEMRKTSAYPHQWTKVSQHWLPQISPKSRSNLNIDQSEAVDETLRKVVQTFNQTLLMTFGGTPNINIGSYNDPMTKLWTGNQPPPWTQMTFKDNYYTHKRTCTMQTKSGITQS